MSKTGSSGVGLLTPVLIYLLILCGGGALIPLATVM